MFCKQYAFEVFASWHFRKAFSFHFFLFPNILYFWKWMCFRFDLTHLCMHSIIERRSLFFLIYGVVKGLIENIHNKMVKNKTSPPTVFLYNVSHSNWFFSTASMFPFQKDKKIKDVSSLWRIFCITSRRCKL